MRSWLRLRRAFSTDHKGLRSESLHKIRHRGLVLGCVNMTITRFNIELELFTPTLIKMNFRLKLKLCFELLKKSYFSMYLIKFTCLEDLFVSQDLLLNIALSLTLWKLLFKIGRKKINNKKCEEFLYFRLFFRSCLV